MAGADLTVVAADSLWWGGQVAGLVAAVVFVVFSAWIVVSRLRGRDGDAHRRRDDDG